jgi:uncharacterized protein (DUF58 family)
MQSSLGPRRAFLLLIPDGEGIFGSMVDISEVLKRVRRIELLMRGLVRESLGGEYHSSFKGQGMDFHDIREYQAGDEVRVIDWNVTARAGAPFIKTFREERQLTVFLLVDVSASGAYGGRVQSKRELAAEVAACFAFSAIHNQDQVGLILFSDHVELFLPPRKGAGNTLRLIREILAWEPLGRRTSLPAATDLLVKSVSRRALCFLVSDFLVPPEQVDEAIRVAAVKHDLVAVQVSDPNEESLPASGRISLEDPESGEQVTINPSRGAVREQYADFRRQWQSDLESVLRSRAMDHLHLRTGDDYLAEVHGFFQRRARRLA